MNTKQFKFGALLTGVKIPWNQVSPSTNNSWMIYLENSREIPDLTALAAKLTLLGIVITGINVTKKGYLYQTHLYVQES